MPTQAVRLSICRNAQEIANAKARDQTLGFTVVHELHDENTNVGMVINIPGNGLAKEIYVHIDANAQPTPPPATVSPPLTLLLSTKALP
jgi:hypothetical protein